MGLQFYNIVMNLTNLMESLTNCAYRSLLLLINIDMYSLHMMLGFIRMFSYQCVMYRSYVPSLAFLCAPFSHLPYCMDSLSSTSCHVFPWNLGTTNERKCGIFAILNLMELTEYDNLITTIFPQTMLILHYDWKLPLCVYGTFSLPIPLVLES